MRDATKLTPAERLIKALEDRSEDLATIDNHGPNLMMAFQFRSEREEVLYSAKILGERKIQICELEPSKSVWLYLKIIGTFCDLPQNQITVVFDELYDPDVDIELDYGVWKVKKGNSIGYLNAFQINDFITEEDPFLWIREPKKA